MVNKLAIVLAGIIFLCGCNSTKQETAPKEKQTDDDISIALMPSYESLPFYVAQFYDLYSKNKLSIKLKNTTTSADIFKEFVSKTADVAVTDNIQIKFIEKKNPNTAYLSLSDSKYKLIANKQSRTTKTSQLLNKTVGFSPHLPKQFPNNIHVDDYHIRYNMLKHNYIDAAILNEPWTTLALLEGGNEVSGNINLPSEIIVYDKSKINRQTFEKLKLCYNAACDSVNKYKPKHFRQIFRTIYKLNNQQINKLPDHNFHHIGE